MCGCSKSRGVTLVEVMAATLIIVVAVLGTSGYRYYSSLDAKRADMQSTAARIALALCENWRGRGMQRSTTYDPVSHLGSELDIKAVSTGPQYPAGFTGAGHYEVVVANVRYAVALAWRDEASGLRALNVTVAWAQRQIDPDGGPETMDKAFRLTTYVSQ